MKRFLAFIALAASAACAHRAPANPADFPPDAEPLPPAETLERYYQVSRTVHRTSGDTLAELLVQGNFLNPNVVCSNQKSPPVRVSLLLRKHAPRDGKVLTLLAVEYEGARPLGHEGGRALEFRLDDAKLSPVRFGNPTRAAGADARETVQYLVTPADLGEIVAAARTSARLSGETGRCDFPISGHARGLIALFAERELGARRTATR